jgi:hypothetical protein
MKILEYIFTLKTFCYFSTIVVFVGIKILEEIIKIAKKARNAFVLFLKSSFSSFQLRYKIVERKI